MAVVRYFVSQQQGNDSNTGLSEAQAWATLTKAAQTVQTPAVGDCHEVVFGPGTYREKLTLSYAGRSATENIRFVPDPNCLYLTNDKPGRCRITGCDSNEIASSGELVEWNSKNYVTFGCDEAEFWADGVKGIALYANNGGLGQNCVRVNAQGGLIGFFYSAATNCTAQGGLIGFYYCTATNCTAQGGSYGFDSCTATNCTAQGGSYGFDSCTATNCTAQGGYYGFYYCTATNCMAQGSWLGFDQCITANCKAAACVKNENQPRLPFDPVIDAPISAGRMGQMPYMPLGIRHLGGRMMPDTSNTVVYDGIDLTAERLIDFTPTKAGTSRAIAIFISAIAASGEITCELQKLVSGSWTTQRSKTIAVANLSDEKLNLFEWDTGGGDDQLTEASDTWRYRITADANAQSTMIAISNDTMMIYIGYFWPDDMPNEDIDGRPRGAYGTQPSIGPWEPPDMTEEWTTCKDKAPAIRLTGNSMHIMKVAAAQDKAITVKWWIRHHGTASDKKPQVWLRGPVIATQKATCTADADTWQQVSVSITPDRDTVLDVCLYARDPATGAYAIFSDPEVS